MPIELMNEMNKDFTEKRREGRGLGTKATLESLCWRTVVSQGTSGVGPTDGLMGMPAFCLKTENSLIHSSQTPYLGRGASVH